MYTPKLPDVQIHELFTLAKVRKRPMTKVLQQIVQEYLDAHREELRVTVKTQICHNIRHVS